MTLKQHDSVTDFFYSTQEGKEKKKLSKNAQTKLFPMLSIDSMWRTSCDWIVFEWLLGSWMV
jgi:hypothetical protein